MVSTDERQLEDGGWWIQGNALDELPRGQGDGTRRLGEMEIVGQDIEVLFLQPGDERPRYFNVPRMQVSIDANRIALDAGVRAARTFVRRSIQ